MNRKKLQIAAQSARDSLDTLHRAVVDELPVGCSVEYNHGDHWIGPCQVVSHRRRDEYGPQIIVRNLKTGKERAICSYNFVRPAGEKA